MPRASLQGLSMEHLHILAQLSWLPPVEQPWSPAAVWTQLALANLQQVPPSYVLLVRMLWAVPVASCRELLAAMTCANVMSSDCC